MDKPVKPAPAPQAEAVRIAVSSCLLGEAVRYDGGDKYYPYLVETLGRFVEFDPLCPEVAIGLGVPRPPIRLVRTTDGVHALGVDDPQLDVSERLQEYAGEVADEIAAISGYVFKQDSPSCGLWHVPVFDADGTQVDQGSGLFAAAIHRRLPNLPVEEEGTLADPLRRDNFLVRVFALHRWQALRRRGLDAASLVDFHTRHKFLILTHDEPAYRALGRLVADAGKGDIRELAGQYETQMMAALRRLATPGQHVNVLMHLTGMIGDRLDPAAKQALLQAIDGYRRGRLPLGTPQTLLARQLRHDARAFAAGELYLDPYPAEIRTVGS